MTTLESSDSLFWPGGLSRRLVDVSPELERLLTEGNLPPAQFADPQIRRQTRWVTMRDGNRLATDIYLPPICPSPTIAIRTPYGRAAMSDAFSSLAQRGYAVVAQDVRGTGESEPDTWDCYVYEKEDSFDLVEWVTKQEWFDGFVAGCGASYLAGTQWCMAMHPGMTTVAPEVGGLGIVGHPARDHMFLNLYSSVARKGGPGKVTLSFRDLEAQMLPETLASGYFNEPLHRALPSTLLERYPQLHRLSRAQVTGWLWKQYAALGSPGRAQLIKEVTGDERITLSTLQGVTALFGQWTALDAHVFACPQPSEIAGSLHAPALLIAGWYDWYLDDILATWQKIGQNAPVRVSSRSRLLITPTAHGGPGYHEGKSVHSELTRDYRTQDIVAILLWWYSAIRGDTTDAWPKVIYYLMGENEWYAAETWPPPQARDVALYLGPGGTLVPQPQRSAPDQYTYDPSDPTPTLGGSITSTLYEAGSVDVSEIQARGDVICYTTEPLEQDLDVVGPLRMMLYASSSAVETDFFARLSDVFPDGRAIQLQNGILRTRFRSLQGQPELLEPKRIYKFEIDMWATANRFKVGHRLRVDISSADFPRFDRNANRGGEPGPPTAALQTIYHDHEHPSHIILSVIDDHSVRS